MLKYQDFEQRFGVLTFERLSNPKHYPLKRLELPVGSIVHYLPHDSVEVGIEPKDPLLITIEDDILVNHIEELKTREGAPKNQTSQSKKMIRDYHRRFRRLRLLRRMESAVKDKRTVIVHNYALTQHLWTYRRTALSTWHAFQNLHNTLWEVVKDTTAMSDRPQFIEMGLPQTLPPLTMFQKANKSLNKEIYDNFSTYESLALLEIFLWLKDDPFTGTDMVQLDQRSLDTLNLIFMETGQWYNLSFAKLALWKEEKGGEAAQKAFYKALEKLMELRSLHNSKKEEEEEYEQHVAEVNPSAEARSKVINEQAIKLAENGLITAKEMDRMGKLATRYQDIKAPDGKGTLEDTLKIDVNDVDDLKTKTVRDIPSVLDKTMLSSTVEEFDRKYVDTYMEKDIANTVMSLQNAGFAVTDYKKEELVDAVNDYDVYTVKIVPVSGESSTLRFRFPRVQKDGTFVANGVKARFAKQRGD